MYLNGHCSPPAPLPALPAGEHGGDPKGAGQGVWNVGVGV